MHKVKMTLGQPADVRVEIDGVPMCCTFISVQQRPDGMAEVSLSVYADQVEITGQAALTLYDTETGEQLYPPLPPGSVVDVQA